MAITLGSITLPDDLLWTDKYRGSQVARRQAFTLDGTLTVDSALKLKGRPITLASSPTFGWATRAVVDDVKALADDPDAVSVLTLHDEGPFNVIVLSLEADPVADYSDPQDDDPHTLRISMIEV